MIFGCYTLDLYCDSGKPQPWRTPGHDKAAQYFHEFGSACRRKARRAGWILKRDGTAICPLCAPRSPKRGAS